MFFFLKVTIIDFTLSRITHYNKSVYNDLAEDTELFTSDGDYQFEIYRLMQKETK
jgi:serine/threonine-protein kinase haspin